MIKLDLIGKRFGRLTVVKRIKSKDKHGQSLMVWVCNCDCGRTTECLTGNLRSGCSQSCGCLQKERASQAQTKVGTAFRNLYRRYKRSAKKKNKEFILEAPLFRALVTSRCFYCGDPPQKKIESAAGEVFIYNGVDRLDNSVGYLPHNCVPCCWPCNDWKGNMKIEDFIAMISKIYKHCEGTK